MISTTFSSVFKKAILFITLLQVPQLIFAQKIDSTKAHINVSGAITATNNGISLIPTFSLGKPATIFDVFVRKNRFSFDPQLRFAIKDAKPWSFIFWLHYKLVETSKFKMSIGAHPSTVFNTTNAVVNGVSKDLITVRRFFAGELTPTYFLSKNVSLGIYYLYSRGLGDASKNTNFVALGCNFSKIKLGGDFNLKFNPQIYYLQIDKNNGYYATSSFTLSNQKFPISISSIINKKLKSSIPSSDFVWNVSLIYSF